MPTDHLNIKIGADASGANAVFDHLGKRVKGLSTEIASGLKGAIVGAIGIGSIAELARSMVDFAKEIKNASDELGVTVERVQELRTEARHAGKELGDVVSVFDHIVRFRQAALSDKGKMDVLKAFGFSAGEVAHLNPNDFFTKLLGGTQKMDQSNATALLDKIAGRGQGPFLAANAKEFQKTGLPGVVSGADIEKVAELGLEFEDLTQEIRNSLMPAFILLADVVRRSIGWLEVLGRFIGGFVNNITHIDFKEALIKGGAALVTGQNPVIPIAASLAKFKNFSMKDAISEANAEIESNSKIQGKLDAESAARKAAFAAEQDRKRHGQINLTASPDSPSILHLEKPDNGFGRVGGGSLLSVGGTLGVDLNYRMSENTKQIAINTRLAADRQKELLDWVKQNDLKNVHSILGASSAR